MKEFDPETLAIYNGKDGQPVYLAHEGKVYDVSESRMWKTGLHMKRHTAGQDLTTDIQAAPHGEEVLEKYPQVGILKGKAGEGEESREPFTALLDRYPFFRRHPHPMLVHFPIVFMISPLLFLILYLLTGEVSFETTSYHCLGAGTLFLIPAILSGFFTWWLNYFARPMMAVQIKIYCSFILLSIAMTAFIWRLFQPEIIVSFNERSFVYIILIALLFPIVSVIGWFGATLSFPLEKGKQP
jgi:predicted heme/steroid binding protein/uncharacterized membrane protein